MKRFYSIKFLGFIFSIFNLTSFTYADPVGRWLAIDTQDMIPRISNKEYMALVDTSMMGSAEDRVLVYVTAGFAYAIPVPVAAAKKLMSASGDIARTIRYPILSGSNAPLTGSNINGVIILPVSVDATHAEYVQAYILTDPRYGSNEDQKISDDVPKLTETKSENKVLPCLKSSDPSSNESTCFQLELSQEAFACRRKQYIPSRIAYLF